ncbi:MAG: hypothetical protein J6X87_01410 [Clostridia bacterium]|nr:hypothetical protein [Clostridia bacterium]
MRKKLCIIIALAVLAATAVSLLPACVSTKEDRYKKETLVKTEIYGDGYNNNMIVGFDNFGRTVPSASGERDSRKVGIFYFVWLGSPMSPEIYDVSKILEEYGKDVLFHQKDDKISPDGQPHWWAEPLFGYYNSLDKWVLRRHLELLTEAGVDFIIFDTTNTVLYDRQVKRIMSMIKELRQEGWNAPQVAFYTHSHSIETIGRIYDIFYKSGEYADTWFRIDGKPMIIGYTEAWKDRAEAESRSDYAYKPENLSEELQEFFYVKEACWPNDEHNENSFPYTEWQYPQPLNGNTMNVSVATHPMVPFSFSLTHENWCNWGRGYDVKTGKNIHEDIMKGTFFQSEWETVFKNDPEIVMVTGWNEWIAFKQEYGGEYMLCDNVDMEYSRDIEPMKGGYEDAYYIQMIANIRKYKYEPADGLIADNVYKTVDVMNGDDSQWDDVKAVYRHVGTVNEARDFAGAADNLKYTVPAARNNILSVKVTSDSENIYFRVECADAVDPDGGLDSMNIFIGTGNCAKKGWESYEYAVNRSQTNGKALIEELSADFSGKTVGEAAFSVNGKYVYFAVPMEALGLGAKTGNVNDKIYFKVADSVENPADIMDYYVSGRSLPEGRLSYEYVFTY